MKKDIFSHITAVYKAFIYKNGRANKKPCKDK